MKGLDLDLDAAIDAAEATNSDWPWWLSGEAVIRAALPHILDALAAKAQARWDTALWGECDCDPYDEACELCTMDLHAKYLRELAKEARGD